MYCADKILVGRVDFTSEQAIETMNVLVCGGRNFADKSKVFDILDSLSGRLGISSILYRAAAKPDELACEWADRRNIPTHCYTPSWESNGKPRAALRANQKRDSQKPHLVIAFPGDEDTVRQAKAVGFTVIEIESESIAAQPCEKPGLASVVGTYGRPG